ncbi:putative ethanolamine kinase [Microsporum ferrugineum]
MPSACTQPVGCHEVRCIPLSYNHADSQASALRLVLTVNPHWKDAQGRIEFVRFTDGITNTLLKITLRAPGLSEEEIDKEAVLMRAYGNNSEIIRDRERETKSHALLASRGLAPPLLARFSNGLLYRFIRGQVASPDDLTNPAIWRGVARRLGQWHAALPISDVPSDALNLGSGDGDTLSLASSDSESKPVQESTSAADDIIPISTRLEGPNLWATLQKWILALPKSTEQERTRRKNLQKEYERIVAEFDDGSGLGEEGMVFAHCDLLSANVIIQPRPKESTLPEGSAETVDFIDYEYATPSPAAFDLANHFAEWAGYDCDYSRLPTRSVRRQFIEEYVDSFSQHSVLPESKKVAVDNLFADVDRYRGLPGFYWGVWALIQATISRIDFDYASYAEERLGEYWAWRNEQDNSRSKAGEKKPLREQRWAQEA